MRPVSKVGWDRTYGSQGKVGEVGHLTQSGAPKSLWRKEI
jgi:hypothetical protein